MSPTGPLYPSVSGQTGTGNSWTNLTNAYAEDAAVASVINIGPGAGGNTAQQLNLTGFGFNLPATALIDGIKLEIKVQTTGGNTANDGATTSTVYLLYNGGNTNGSNTPNKGQNWPTSALTWLTYGGSTSLWGKSWTYGDINNANFGVSLAAFPFTGGTSTLNVDAARLTVYWHTAPVDVPKRYVYQVYNGGSYLANLPNVISDFQRSLDINTAGTHIEVTCAVSADTSSLPNSILLDENGNAITDESGNSMLDEGTPPIVAVGYALAPAAVAGAGSVLTDESGNPILDESGNTIYDEGAPVATSAPIIRNGNKIIVYEYSYWNPNGKIVFRGSIWRWQANFGGDGEDDTIQLSIYSDGSDLDNHLVRGSPFSYTTDVSQTSQNGRINIYTTGGTYVRLGQTWKVGGGVTNLGGLHLMLSGTATVTINVYDGVGMINLLGTTSQAVSVGDTTDVLFGFANHIAVTAGNTYFFTVSVADGQSIYVYDQNTAVYANGTMYQANYGGGGGGGFGAQTGDLYFITASSTGSTTATYSAQDPTTGILETIMNDYAAEGGLISYTSSSIQATGLSIPLGFNTNTVYEGIKTILSASPSGFYYYVDPGTDILYFKQVNTTADITLTKGIHIQKLNVVATIEQLVNAVYFTGGLSGGVNLFKLYSDATSLQNYGTFIDRPTNNQVTDSSAADAIGKAELASRKRENYETVVTVQDHTMDITTLMPGMTVGFNGFGTFIDSMLLEIVRVDYTPEYATLTLGLIPKRLHIEVEKVIRGYIGLQTVNNPSAPS